MIKYSLESLCCTLDVSRYMDVSRNQVWAVWQPAETAA